MALKDIEGNRPTNSIRVQKYVITAALITAHQHSSSTEWNSQFTSSSHNANNRYPFNSIDLQLDYRLEKINVNSDGTLPEIRCFSAARAPTTRTTTTTTKREKKNEWTAIAMHTRNAFAMQNSALAQTEKKYIDSMSIRATENRLSHVVQSLGRSLTQSLLY